MLLGLTVLGCPCPEIALKWLITLKSEHTRVMFEMAWNERAKRARDGVYLGLKSVQNDAFTEIKSKQF